MTLQRVRAFEPDFFASTVWLASTWTDKGCAAVMCNGDIQYVCGLIAQPFQMQLLDYERVEHMDLLVDMKHVFGEVWCNPNAYEKLYMRKHSS